MIRFCLLNLAALALMAGGPAVAQEVYPGCAAPPTTFNHIWYFDPVKGQTEAAMTAAGIPMPAKGSGPTSSTQGSAQHPWNDLSALDWADNNVKTGYTYPLLSTVPHYQINPVTHSGYGFFNGPRSGPIEPGDEILLMGGTYAPLIFNVPRVRVVNNAFLTIAAAPGQTPFIPLMKVADINMLRFTGIKVQSAEGIFITDGGGANDALGHALVTQDLVFDHMDVSNADRSVYLGWTQAQWASNGGGTFGTVGTNLGANTFCISLAQSHIYAAHEGPVLNTEYSLVADNEIDHITDNFTSHGGSSHQKWLRNFLHDVVDVGLAYHPDGSQGEGFPLPKDSVGETFTDIELDSNLLIDRYDPTNPYPFAMTGMDDYSGVGFITWDHLKITNNVFISSGTCILYELNIVNSLIANNICLPSGFNRALPGISISLTNNSNNRICNNIATAIGYSSPGVTMDHNIASKYIFSPLQPDGAYGKGMFATKPGFYGMTGGPVERSATATNQLMPLASLQALFKQAPNTTKPTVPPVYDLTPALGSVAATFGAADCGPQSDATGAAGPVYTHGPRRPLDLMGVGPKSAGAH